jgi:hypothetical protein
MLVEVSKEVFFEKIGPQDVVLDVTGEFPYTSIFKTRYCAEVGRVVDSFTDNVKNKFPMLKKYFLVKN